jgi:hypothetical protein
MHWLAHVAERLHEEITEDYNEMIYGKTPEEIESIAKPSSASGGSNTKTWPTAWRKPATGSSP